MPNAPEPKMSWARGGLLIGLAVLFDGFKALFASLIVTGPVMVGLLVALYANDTWWLSWAPSWMVGTVAGAATGVAELVPGVAEAVGFFGTIIAMAIAFLGWMIFVSLFAYWRINFFHRGGKRFMWALGSAIVSLIPILDIIPSFTPTIWFIVLDQRKEDVEFRRKFEAESRAALAQTQARIQQKAVRQRPVEQMPGAVPEAI